MSVYKSILRNSSGYSVSIVVGRIVSVLMLPITTHFLGPADFGVLELLDLTLYVFGTLVGIQLGESLLFYYFATNSTETRNHVASTAILGSFMLGTVIATGGWFMAPGLSQAVFRDPQYTGLLRLACCNLGLTCPMETGLSWLRAHNLPFRYNVVALLRIGIAAVLNFVFLAFYGLGVASLQWSALVTTGILSVALCSWVMWQTGCFFPFPDCGSSSASERPSRSAACSCWCCTMATGSFSSARLRSPISGSTEWLISWE